MKSEIKCRVAIVTGGCGGVGIGVSKFFAKEGDHGIRNPSYDRQFMD